MAITEHRDIEKGDNKGLEDLVEPLVENKSKNVDISEHQNDSITMVLLSTAVAVCGSLEFGTCVGYTAPTQSAIVSDLNLSVAEYSLFGSIVTIGAMIGAVTSGRIADTIGRKGAMGLSAVFCIAGWLAIFFAMGAYSLDTGRFFTGYGIGIFSYVVPIYIAEISPKDLRGGLTTLNQLMIVTGSSISFLLGTIVSWRILALVGLIPPVFLLVGLLFIPESPRWLAKVGLELEFNHSLRKLRGKKANISAEADEIHESIVALQSLPKARLLDLFDAKYIRPVIIAVGLMVCQQSGGINGIGFYASQTFETAGYSSGKVGTILYALIQIPVTIIGVILMDKSGRRALLLVSSSGTFLGCFLAGTSFYFKDQGIFLEWVPLLAASGVLIFIAAFSIGMGAVPWLIMSEIFPLHIKGAAGSLVVLVNWLGAWVVSYSFNFLIVWSPAGTFWLFSGFCVATVVFVAKLVPETKGKSLEEIQASINS
ncbi:sugar transporter ERD6-like 16 [Cynara cardunculus var. scolymus]|uniref:sugar transporter ERD6-like 16 n=1 Tax=Cynara cardunculus var. scolymus TaxID=59895 RepID=UPI000D62B364|nr:sugar transporter ERD6-like 16 [Cynara cardunculus var. scolymus]